MRVFSHLNDKNLFSKIYMTLFGNIALFMCGISVFLIILTGSYFQLLLESVLFPSRTTIMQTAAKGGVVLFPSVFDAIFSLYTVPLLVIGLLSVAPLLKERLVIEQSILCAATLSVLLTINDMLSAGQTSSFTSLLITNSLFNFVGSIAIFTLFFFVAGFLNNSFINNTDVAIDRRIAVTIVGAAALLSTSLFLTTRFFLRPLDVDFKAVMPGTQTISFQKMNNDERTLYNVADKSVYPDFRSVLDGIALNNKIELNSYNQNVQLISNRPFRINIFTEKRCESKSSRKMIYSANDKAISLFLGQYGSKFDLFPNNKLMLSLEQDGIGQESIKIKSGRVVVSSFITGPASASVSGDLAIRINAAIFQDNLASDGRSLTIKSLNTTRSIKLPNVRDASDDNHYCSNRSKLPASFRYDTAYLEIKNLAEGSLLKIKAPGGIIRRGNITLAEVQGKDLGVSSFFAVSATKIDGTLGTEKFPTSDAPVSIWLKGRINLRWNENGEITAEGTSDAAWFNGKMGSQTKWESLGDEWQRWAIGGTIAAFIFAARFVLKVFWSVRLKRVVMG